MTESKSVSGVLLCFDPGSPVPAWVEALELAAPVEATIDVIACSPSKLDVARERVGAKRVPIILCVPSSREFVAQDAIDAVGLRADAYASDLSSLAAAMRFVRSEDLVARERGELRLTYLGSLGEPRPRSAPEIGESVLVGDGGFLGRDQGGINLRQGAHSDQNTVARRHARVEAISGASRARVTDCNSTNGTWIGGAKIGVAEIVPGDEIAIAWSHRFRLDGAR